MKDILSLKTEKEIAGYVGRNIGELIPGIEVIKSHVEKKAGKFVIDLLLDVRMAGTRKKLVCEIKSVGEPRYLFQAVAQLKHVNAAVENSYPVVIAPVISERGQAICKEGGVGYLDLTGNVFLKFDGVYIEKTVQERPKKRKD
ncbi:MAG: hypothetical protein V3R93_03415, partial [Candidatus Hydrothermarchaeaceae archaeon]